MTNATAISNGTYMNKYPRDMLTIMFMFPLLKRVESERIVRTIEKQV